MQSILKVLILEDVNADAILMEHELARANIKFISKIVQNKKDFLNELNSFNPDIILSDYRLPAFNGLEALEIVKKVSAEIPFIIVTGTLDEVTAANCIKKGAWDYVLKGNLIRLGSAVQEALKLKEEIEKRKLAEQSQQEIEQQYREIFNSSTDAFLIFDLKGNIKDANPKACKMYGYKYKDLIKLSGKDIIHPDYYHIFKNFKVEVRIEGEFFTESVDIHKDGTFFDVEVKGAEINYKGKSHLLAIVRDISKRKQADKMIQESEEKLRNFINTTTIGIWCFKPESPIDITQPVEKQIDEFMKSVCIECNETYAAMMGSTRDKILGIKLYEVLPDNVENREYFREFIKEGYKLDGGESHEISKTGEEKYFSNSFVATIIDNKITEAWGTQTDITGRKKAEETQKVLYNIAHAINTTKTLDELYQSIHIQLGKIIDTTNFYIALYDKENDTILFPYHIDEIDKYTSYPARKTLTAYVIRTGKPLLGTEEVIEQLIEAGEIGKGKKDTCTKFWVGVPLIVDNVAIGAIAVQSYNDASIYSEKDLEILEFVSDEIALAIKRKQAEQALQHEKDFYHSFVESLSDWVWEIDIQGVHTYSNKAVKNILGYEVDEVIGFSTKKLWTEKQQRKSDKWYREELTSGKGWKNFSAYFQHKDGSVRILESTAIPIYDTEKKLVGYRGIDHDITSRRQALQKIQESEEKYRTLTENLNVAVYRSMAYDKNKLIEINSAFVKMFGYKNKDEIKKLKVSSLYQNPKERKQFVRKMTKNNFVKNEELILKRKDGSKFIGSISAVLGRDRQGTGLYIDGFIEDITERKKAEEALQKSNKKLRKLHKELEEKVKKAVKELRDKDHILIHQSRQASMGEMIGNIAHQWRQPLSAVAAIIQNYEDAFEDEKLDMDYIEEHTDLIMDILQQMSRTIDDFRNFFKPNKLKVDFNVKEVVLNTIKFLENSIKFNNIKLVLNLPDNCIFTGFPNEYSQVILVILNNAKDVLLERKIKEKEIKINLEKEKNKIILKITDNAGGITPEVMDKIFNPYFTTKEDKGTGVGLYMSKMIIEKNMKGKLSFGNTKKGAEFKIEI
ncbi:MAG: PAS domain S-box protein [Armatimonadetes bacterium]|nr:PAS domain S-box protein [Armatimonadota bacterium]